MVNSPQLGADIERSLSKSIDSLSTCGTGTAIIFMMLVLALGLVVYLIRRNAQTVEMVLKALIGEDHAESDKKDH